MEGRYPYGLRLVHTNCTDATREAEFNHWYDQTHLPDILRARVATIGLRYQNADLQPGDAKYLALYEINRHDLAHVDEEFGRVSTQLAEQSRMHSTLEIVSREMWRRIGPEFTSGKTGEIPVAGIWMIQSRCLDPGQVQQFTAWYEDTHIPDLLSTGLFITAYRFEAASPVPGDRYLAIYEAAIDPRDAVEEFVRAHRPRLRAAGRLSDLIEVTSRGTFYQMARGQSVRG